MKIFLYQNWASGSYSSPQCKACGRKMLLTVQIYAPLDDSPNHRTLFVFCCLQPKCQTVAGGWLCLRDEVPDALHVSPNKPPQTVVTAPKTTWLDDADDWGEEGMVTDHTDQAVSHLKMDSLSLENQKTNISETIVEVELQQKENNVPSAEVESVDESVLLDDYPSKPTVDIRALLLSPSAVGISDELCNESEFSSFYLNVVEEQVGQLSDQKLDQRARELWEEYQRRENCDLKKMQKSKSAQGGVDETYEKLLPSHGDRLVHKFIKQVQHCPTQLIRYGREESPLLLRPLSKDFLDVKCHHCNASLVFEMQLMPHLSQRLTVDNQAASHQPVEIGTVVIFTCSKSCWNGTLREEYLVVQSEMY